MRWMDEDIERYVENQTEPLEPIFEELARVTHEQCQSPEMQVGKLEGTFLRMLVSLTGAKSILELGTFTGYSAMMMASALPENGVLFTVEKEEERAKIARSFFDRVAYGSKIEILSGEALDILEEFDAEIDFAFIDADKQNYPIYYEEILDIMVPGGLIVLDNMLWNGDVLSPQEDAAKVLNELNMFITSDSRVENILLPVRDGVMLARKK